LQGIQGLQGLQGITGPTGAKGATGATGSCGVNAILTAFNTISTEQAFAPLLSFKMFPSTCTCMTVESDTVTLQEKGVYELSYSVTYSCESQGAATWFVINGTPVHSTHRILMDGQTGVMSSYIFQATEGDKVQLAVVNTTALKSAEAYVCIKKYALNCDDE
jgi:hypothetical protein